MGLVVLGVDVNKGFFLYNLLVYSQLQVFGDL
jgi:hypothetical protein